MKFKIIIFFSVFLCTIMSYAIEHHFFAEFKAGAYIFSDKRTQLFFHKAAFTPELEFGCSVSNHFSVGLGGQFLKTCGKACLDQIIQVGISPDNETNYYISSSSLRTVMHLGTLFVPLKIHSCFTDRFDWYLSGGPKVLFARVKYCSPFVSNVDKNVGGGFIGAGINANCCCVLIDAFFEYSFYSALKTCCDSTVRSCNSCTKQNCLNVNGLTIGLGIGIKK